MTDSLSDLLKKRGNNEPPEIKIIKQYVQDEVGLIPKVAVSRNGFTITMPNAGAAGTLRLKLFPLQRQLGHDKQLIIRISS